MLYTKHGGRLVRTGDYAASTYEAAIPTCSLVRVELPTEVSRALTIPRGGKSYDWP